MLLKIPDENCTLRFKSTYYNVMGTKDLKTHVGWIEIVLFGKKSTKINNIEDIAFVQGTSDKYCRIYDGLCNNNGYDCTCVVLENDTKQRVTFCITVEIDKINQGLPNPFKYETIEMQDMTGKKSTIVTSMTPTAQNMASNFESYQSKIDKYQAVTNEWMKEYLGNFNDLSYMSSLQKIDSNTKTSNAPTPVKLNKVDCIEII